MMLNFSCKIFVFVVLLGSQAYLLAASATMRVGYPQPSGAMLPLWLVSEAKLDQKYGVPVQNIFISGAARMTQSMVAGDIDLASIGGAVVNTVLAGGDLVAIAVGVPTYGFSFYARARSQGYRQPARQSRRHHEQGRVLRACRDRFAPASQPAARQGRKVYLSRRRARSGRRHRAGIVSAGVLSSPTTLMARRLGQKELVNIATLGLPYMHSGVATRRRFARQQPERIKAYLRAYIAAIKIANEDAETSKRALAAIWLPVTVPSWTKPIKPFAEFFREYPTSPRTISSPSWRLPKIPRRPPPIPRTFLTSGC